MGGLLGSEEVGISVSDLLVSAVAGVFVLQCFSSLSVYAGFNRSIEIDLVSDLI